MFITLTIDTNIKNKKTVRLNKSKISPSAGWRKGVNMKKRTSWQKIKDWRKSLHSKNYNLNGQTAIF